VTKLEIYAILKFINLKHFSEKFNDNAVILCVTLNQHEKSALRIIYKTYKTI